MMRGVEILDKKRIPDERGTVSHFITDLELEHFGECYITTVYDGVVKGWHGYHSKTMWYCVPCGMVHLVLWDNRQDSESKGQIDELFLGDMNYQVVKIPPGVMNSFRGITHPMSLVVVVADEKFDEHKTIRISLADAWRYGCSYDWSRK